MFKRNCFCCNKQISSVFVDDENPHDFESIKDPPNDATCWTSSGNYGSQVLDLPEDFHYLEITICDECLKKNIDRCIKCRKHTKTTIERVT